MTDQHMISAEDAKELALTYHWLMRDLSDNNHCGVCIYGDWLQSMQDRMGVELISTDSLRRIVAGANHMYDLEATEGAKQ